MSKQFVEWDDMFDADDLNDLKQTVSVFQASRKYEIDLDNELKFKSNLK